jgi:2-oxoglutarate ferredoxin oxidoreductase subunit beta
VVSPCVTFNNHVGSTKSYAFTREHMDPVPLDFVPMREEIRTSYAAGATQEVCMHDGSVIRLHKQSNDYDIEDSQAALNAIAEHRDSGRVLTGLLYIDRDAQEMHEILGTVRRPLNTLTEKELCPGTKVLDSINAGLR